MRRWFRQGGIAALRHGGIAALRQGGIAALRQGGIAAGQVGHHGLRLIGTLALVLMLLIGAAAWRLSRGPVDLPILASRIATAATNATPGLIVTIGHAGLAWEGFHRGGAPIDLRLTGIAILAQRGAVAARVSGLRITVAPLLLLRGRIAPIHIIADHTAIAFRPNPTPPNTAGPPPPATAARGPAVIARLAGRIIASIATLPRTGALDLDRLARIGIGQAKLSIEDAPAGLVLNATDGRLNVIRDAAGNLHGTASASFHHGSAIAPLLITITGAAGLGEVDARLGPFDPAKLAPAQPTLAHLDLPTTITARWPVGRRATARLDLGLKTGPGHVTLGGGTIALSMIDATLSATPQRATLDHAAITLRDGSKARVSGALALIGAGAGAFEARVDHVTAADLPADWPPNLARGARKYVVNHVPAGIATNGVFHATTVLADAAGTPGLTAFSGKFAATGVTLDWFKGATPMTALAGTLAFTDINDLMIDATSGKLGGLGLRGTMTISDLTHHDQNARIVAQLKGDVAAAVPLLDAPPLRLATDGIALTGATGTLTAGIDADLPLVKHLTLKQVTLAAAVDLTSLHLPLPVPGLALDQGTVALSATLHHLGFSGGGALAGSPAKFAATMTLPARTFTLHADTTIARPLLAKLGVPPGLWRHGTAPLAIVYRDTAGRGLLTLDADLTSAALSLAELGWHKQAGLPGHATLAIALRHGSPAAVRRIDIAGPDLLLQGTSDDGPLLISAARLGGTRATGKLTPPAATGAPWVLALAGRTLDLSTILDTVQSSSKPKPKPAPQRKTPTPAKPVPLPWHLRAAFDRVRLHKFPAPALGPLHIDARGDNAALLTLDSSARTDATNIARLHFARIPGAAIVTLTAGDAGALFSAIGTTTDIAGGTIRLTAATQGATTKGHAVMTDFRLRHAPVIAKVLQGLSLYGVPAATSGPGLAITRLVAPFSETGSVVRLGSGRAASASLGFTATGTIDLAHKTYDLSGTIVPAYAINTLPGRIPVIGRLFSPEKGSGLFAARYSVVGPFAKPNISVNPLSVLTPGFLREIFNVFNQTDGKEK